MLDKHKTISDYKAIFKVLLVSNNNKLFHSQNALYLYFWKIKTVLWIMGSILHAEGTTCMSKAWTERSLL